MSLFQGTQEVSLDGKGRIAVPTKQRAHFAAGAVITAHPDGCLLLYPSVVWDTERPQFVAPPNAGPRERWLQRVIIGGAEGMELDTAGRILIPQVLREFAHLKTLVRFVGMNNKFELWDAESYQTEYDTQRPTMINGAMPSAAAATSA